MESISHKNNSIENNVDYVDYVECEECKLFFSNDEINDHLLSHRLFREIKENPEMTEEEINERFEKYHQHQEQSPDSEPSFLDKACSFFSKQKDNFNDGMTTLQEVGSKVVKSIKEGVVDFITDSSQTDTEVNQARIQEDNEHIRMRFNNNGRNLLIIMRRYDRNQNRNHIMINLGNDANDPNDGINLFDSGNYDSNLNIKDNEELNEIINLLPITKLRANDKIIKQKTDCVICLSNFIIDDQLTSLPCTHVFHNECISKWLLETGDCPICKLRITKEVIFGNFDSNNI